jgi:hypothetical protein
LNVTSQASISTRYELPIGQGKRWVSGASGIENKLLSGWQINGTSALLSGFPFTPQIGVLPVVGTWGNLGRSTFTGPGVTEVDISFFKNTAISEKISSQFRAEVFNVLNHPNLGTPNPIVFAGTLPATGSCVVGNSGPPGACSSISPSAGLITTTVTPPRQIQFGLKLIF